jgi:hypothetical protein
MFAPRRLAALAASLALLALAAVCAGTGRADPGPRVSIVSDSILTSVTWGNEPAQAALFGGLDVQIDAGVCRRLNGQSCDFNGGHVPTTLQVLSGWGNLGSVVVIVDGYNDVPTSFAADVEIALDTLRSRGVGHVLWVNLHAVRQEYVEKNTVLANAARSHPELRVLDWNTYSSAHREWYQDDLVHLVPAGGVAIAAWLHQAIVDALAPSPAPAAATPARALAAGAQRVVARAGMRIDRRLRVVGGVAPFRWRMKGRGLRRMHLHLLAGGELRGRPTHPGRYRVPLEVVDATGATVRVVVRVTVRLPRHHR